MTCGGNTIPAKAPDWRASSRFSPIYAGPWEPEGIVMRRLTHTISRLAPLRDRTINMLSKLSPQHEYLPQIEPGEEATCLRVDDKNQVAEVVTHVLIGEASDGRTSSKLDSDISDMSDGTLKREFQKLSVADKLKYNQFYMFHYQSQRADKTCGLIHQRQRHQVRSEMMPKMPEVVAIEEMKEVEVERNIVQVEMMVDESGKEVCRILPVLVKEEPDRQHTTWAPANETLGMPELPPRADVKELLRTKDLKSYDEEATDSEGYLPDDLATPKGEDSSAAESMEEEILPIDIEAFDATLKEIVTGLEMAAIGYHHLRALLPQLPVHEIPKWWRRCL